MRPAALHDASGATRPHFGHNGRSDNRDIYSNYFNKHTSAASDSDQNAFEKIRPDSGQSSILDLTEFW